MSGPLSPAMFDASRVKSQIAPAMLCLAVGIVMSALPDVIAWSRTGWPVWINGDGFYYLTLASQAYFNHPAHLSDPAFSTDGVSLYRQLPLLPGEIIARALR